MYYSFYALEYIFQKRKINIAVLIFTVAIFIILLCYPAFINKNIIDNTIRVFVITMLIIYTILLGLVSKVKNITYLKYVFLITVFFELCYSVNITANKRGIYTMKALKTNTKMPFHDYSYNDYSVDAIKYIQYRDSTFYRIDRTYDSSDMLNFSLVQGYNGTSCYNDLNQLYYIKYLQLMGVASRNNEKDSRWTAGLSNNPILESENSVKYFLLYKNNFKHLSPVIWDSLTMIGDVKIFKNKLLLPFGFTYDQFIKESNFEIASPKQKEFITLKAFVINDKDVNKIGGIKEYQLKDTITRTIDSDTYGNDLKNLKTDTLAITKFNDNYLSGTINTSEDKMMYLSIPYDDEWYLQVDGKNQEKMLVNGGMTGVFLKKGLHTVKMCYVLRYGQIGLLLSFLGIILFAGLWYYLKRKNREQINKGKPTIV
jgi:uncharacterized membrane protein YfhO